MAQDCAASLCAVDDMVQLLFYRVPRWRRCRWRAHRLSRAIAAGRVGRQRGTATDRVSRHAAIQARSSLALNSQETCFLVAQHRQHQMPSGPGEGMGTACAQEGIPQPVIQQDARRTRQGQQ